MQIRLGRLFGLLLVASLAVACSEDPFPLPIELQTMRGLYRQLDPPVSPTNRFADDPAARALGTKLFNDPGLSSCGTVSCASCHVAPGYTTQTAKATGCGGETGRNPPTLLNVAFNDWYFWDGNRDSLWAQPSGPMLNPVEMAASGSSLRDYMQQNYAADYRAVFNHDPDQDTDDDAVVANLGKVFAAYERQLIRVRSPFDDKLKHFITSAENGQAETDPYFFTLKTFVRIGNCAVCHNGPMLSDGKFHNIGVDDHGVTDHGRLDGIQKVLDNPWNGSGPYSDDTAVGGDKLDSLRASSLDGMDGAFKTPSLRNVALTGPYMQNGSIATLRDVIEFYNRGGDPPGTFTGARTSTIIPLNLTDDEKQALLDLLSKDLTGSETP